MSHNLSANELIGVIVALCLIVGFALQILIFGDGE